MGAEEGYPGPSLNYGCAGLWLDVEVLSWVQGDLNVDMRSIRCVEMGWDGYEGPWVGEGVLELI